MNVKICSGIRSFLIIALIFMMIPVLGEAAGTPKKKETGPPTMHGVVLPPGAVRLHEIAGSASYRVPENVQSLEKIMRAMFAGAKDVSTSTRVIGRSYMVFLENKDQQPWSTIQISGIVGENVSYLVINGIRPDEIDKYK